MENDKLAEEISKTCESDECGKEDEELSKILSDYFGKKVWRFLT